MVVVATLEIALTVWLAGEVFAIFYILIAFYAAYIFRDRRMIAAQFALASLMALLPIVYEPETARETVIQGARPDPDPAADGRRDHLPARAAGGERGALPPPRRERPPDRASATTGCCSSGCPPS